MSFFTDFIKKLQSRTYYIGGSGTRSRPKNISIETQENCVAILDTNATHISKGQVLHVVVDEDDRIKKILRKSEYTRLFRNPNRMMSGIDFMYAMAYQLQVTNTAFAWIKWDRRMHPVEVWPLTYLNFEVRRLLNGELAVQITDGEGQTYVVNMEDLIVLRRRYDGSGYAGASNLSLSNTLEMVDELDESLMQAANISNKIHGLLKKKNAMMVNAGAKETQDEFSARMEHASKTGGVITIDAMEEYQPLNVSTWSANAVQTKQVTDRIYTFWRTPEEVVKNTATEQIMQNYYSSIVEPVWQAMAEAFTRALFTGKEQGYGNRIIVSSGAATGASWQTKLNLITNTKDFGLLTINEYRELVGYAPVEGGDERQVSLNYIKSSEQSKYQTGKDEKDRKENENEPKQEDP